MKLSFRYLLLLCCAVLAVACHKRVEPTTVEVKDPERHYFPVLQGQELNIVFPVTNTGENPLVINEIQSSCGCIILNRKSHIIVPAGRVENIRMTYNSNKNVGKASHTIWVYGNIVPDGVLKLRFDVNVVPDADYTRDYEQLYHDYNVRNGFVDEFVDGRNPEQSYYTDPSGATIAK